VIHTFAGEPGGYLGWTVSELTDVDGDGVTDLIAGEPDAAGAAGRTWVWSGRTGGVLHRFDGAPGDNRGYAIADAGDTDGDGIDDVITGAPGADPAAGPAVRRCARAPTGRSCGRSPERPRTQVSLPAARPATSDGDGRGELAIGSYRPAPALRSRAAWSCSPLRAMSCGRSRARPRARTSASTSWASGTSTPTASATCWSPLPRADTVYVIAG